MQRSRWVTIIWIVLVGIISVSLLRSIWLSRQAQQQVVEEQKRFDQIQQQVDDLDGKVREATSSYELEKRVREDLGQQKPGEKIIELSP